MPGPSQDVPRRASAARRLLAPVERFLAVESAGGIVLLVAAALALAWANSPWSATYPALFGPLHFAINDGLMTVFFFVVGLEIRRELSGGELATRRRAALPLAAALGGMVVPALLFTAVNAGTPSARGWGTPMATDIAFAVGVLALLGSRVPPALRVLLLALAVLDDIGAIVVIALFYAGQIAPAGFLVAAAGLLGVVVLQRLGAKSPWLYVPAAALTWLGAYLAGVHPTLAGVAVGLMTPAAAVEGLERALHGWVAFAIMPLFALANAGVPLGAISVAGDASRVLGGVTLGLVIGKPLGITAGSWIAVRLGVAALPSGVGWKQVGVVGLAGGIGFTMAIFIAALAFPAGPLLETAKLAILAASAAAGALALLAGRALLPRYSAQASD